MFQKKSFFGRLQEKIEDVIFMRPEVDEEMLRSLKKFLSLRISEWILLRESLSV